MDQIPVFLYKEYCKCILSKLHLNTAEQSAVCFRPTALCTLLQSNITAEGIITVRSSHVRHLLTLHNLHTLTVSYSYGDVIGMGATI